MQLSFWNLFFGADWMGQSVILILIFCSFWSWRILFVKFFLLRRLYRLSVGFEKQFQMQGKTLQSIYENLCQKPREPFAALLKIALQEIAKMPSKDLARKESLKSDIEELLLRAAQKEMMRLKQGIDFLASIASSAPFIGLFGTVWGIMNSFEAIARAGNTNLTVVAPAISEALFATALGLFVAIPASLAYNKIASDFQRYHGQLRIFSQELSLRLAREFCKIGR